MTILIATDFSEAAANAVEYGMQFAEATGAKVILFNAYQVYPPASPLSLEISNYAVYSNAKQKLDNEVGNISKGSKITIEAICEEGNAEYQIMKICSEKKVDYIIAGMKRIGVDLRKIFGDTVTGLAKNAAVPVLVIPRQAVFAKMKTIVFASDMNLETELPSLTELIKITLLFKSALYVIKVIKYNDEYLFNNVDIPKQLKLNLKILDPSYKYPFKKDIRIALNEFVHGHNADMLVMMPHKHAWLKRLFTKSETKEMIFHTHVPLLIIPEKKKEIMQTITEENENVIMGN